MRACYDATLGEVYRYAVRLAGSRTGGEDLTQETFMRLQQLQPESFDTAGIAAALRRWCESGCDTNPVGGLTFTGGYEVTKREQTIRATWYEGSYGVHGAPFHYPDLASSRMAGWPAGPAWPDVSSLPYLLPTAPVPQSEAARSATGVV